MDLNARQLGAEFGLTAQEMNFILREEGFLYGEPGAYGVTDKGAPYASERDFHRGVGGYSTYNKYWTARRWDESITDEFEIDADRKRELREAIAAAKQLKLDVDAVETPAVVEASPDSTGLTDAQKALILAVGVVLVAATAYGVYKLTPTIKRLWTEKVAPNLKALKDRIWGDADDEGATRTVSA